jgi:predicted ribosomally synthesized peptide with SipW-like signal peptide
MKGIGWRLVRLASWRTLLVMALTMGVLGMQTGRGTLAYFTDSVTSVNTFTAGTLALKINGANPTASMNFTVTSKLKPGDTSYGYFTLDNTDPSAVDALFNNCASPTTNCPITIYRGATGATADAFDGRVNFAVKDVTANATPITSSALCSTHFNDGSNVALTVAAPYAAGASAGASRANTPLSASPAQFITSPITLTAGSTFKYCMQLTWVDGTPALDNLAKLGSNAYTVTFTAASS